MKIKLERTGFKDTRRIIDAETGRLIGFSQQCSDGQWMADGDTLGKVWGHKTSLAAAKALASKTRKAS